MRSGREPCFRDANRYACESVKEPPAIRQAISYKCPRCGGEIRDAVVRHPVWLRLVGWLMLVAGIGLIVGIVVPTLVPTKFGRLAAWHVFYDLKNGDSPAALAYRRAPLPQAWEDGIQKTGVKGLTKEELALLTPKDKESLQIFEDELEKAKASWMADIDSIGRKASAALLGGIVLLWLGSGFRTKDAIFHCMRCKYNYREYPSPPYPTDA